MKRQIKGKIVSDKMNKTVVVEVSSKKKHPKYLKYFNVSTKFKAHDEENKYKTGQIVIIEETRPISKDKCWVVVSLVEDVAKEELDEEIIDKAEETKE
ncbi:MAG: 30S ribosomal protein S17 [Candidatus Harrisonbacteria bacterium CG10_big_fil_rev_8_21_14_0_10_45_28]|uniref:Small ribosomal subunit protein uS17 n=1 Tax=Candidatus Harrisonbacteria bacterium CG10_big_fil_rev_8_21_14_0_10_45_28 TaxID=1974586 RepID=A0A2H0UNY3_9BACT|nr:MAG: 30S ribosomal protein S17 [Candidatus Harrisonbacteria bacterium CG10_big_fil_rev_8_21_14_0_10_45_28]